MTAPNGVGTGFTPGPTAMTADIGAIRTGRKDMVMAGIGRRATVTADIGKKAIPTAAIGPRSTAAGITVGSIAIMAITPAGRRIHRATTDSVVIVLTTSRSIV